MKEGISSLLVSRKKKFGCEKYKLSGKIFSILNLWLVLNWTRIRIRTRRYTNVEFKPIRGQRSNALLHE